MKFRRFESRATLKTMNLVNGSRSVSNLHRLNDGSVLCAMIEGISYRLVKYGTKLMCFRASDSHPIRCTVSSNKVQIGTKWISVNKLTRIYG